MYIYKVINKIDGKWYIGKQVKENSYYLGSGKKLKNAINKHGKENFEKIILEYCDSKEILNNREKYWISKTNAVVDPNSYNIASGGEGGDLSKFIDYEKRGNKSDNFSAARLWFQSLSKEQKKELHNRQASKRTKGWYVSKINDPTETYVQNISKWCEENGVDKSMPSSLNSPTSRLYQKQTKGWRIRRSDMPPLLPYENNRNISRPNDTCRGRTWKLVNGKREWFDKYNEDIVEKQCVGNSNFENSAT